MCGIVGFWDDRLSQEQASVLLGRMCGVIAHRGPDDEGRLLTIPVALGMRRLSIIDVAGGHQPIGNEDGSIQIVFNGEIYNYSELREELVRRGHTFVTKSDTEAIVHAYEEYGTACFAHLWGMFAITIWDSRRRRLILARDRFGKKPLFYYRHAGGMIFGSEIKTLLQDPMVPRDLDPVALDRYFSFGYVPGLDTVFRGIRRLAPGGFLTFDGSTLHTDRYWRLELKAPLAISEVEAADEVRRLLRDAVRRRLMSDVPLGAFLSGGIDSSSVVACMAQVATGTVKTFSIGFDEQDFSELRYARETARTFGTEHHEEIVRVDAVAELPDLVRAVDEPFADDSILPTYYLSRMTRQHVTVALSGDGGDEAFAGYTRYLENLPHRLDGHLPAPARSIAGIASAVLPEEVRGKNRLYRMSLSRERRYLEALSHFSSRVRSRLYAPAFRERLRGCDAGSMHMQEFAATRGNDLVTRMQYVDVGTYLVDDILTKVDRASMWTSLEVRAPLLDHRLVEFAMSLPPAYLVRTSGKYILKKAMRGIVPDVILDRKKMGFGTPVTHWFRGTLGDFARDVLLDGTLASRGILSQKYVATLLRQHQRGSSNHAGRLWALLSFELWCRTYVDTSAPPMGRAGPFGSALPVVASVE